MTSKLSILSNHAKNSKGLVPYYVLEGKKFAIITLDLEHKAFVIYIAALNTSFNIGDKVHSLKKAQIAYLKVDKTPIKVFSKYIDFVNVFLLNFAIKLFKHISINDYTIEFVDD